MVGAMSRTLALRIAAPLILALSVSACGNSANDDVVEQADSTGSDEKESNELPTDEQGSIIESGFGQGDSEYVWVTALVENKSDHVGQTVTVSFNLKDESGEVVATTDQVESFNWPGQKVAVGTQADVDPGVRVASVEATLLVEDDNAFGTESSDDLGTAIAEVVKSEYGDYEARYTVKNAGSTPLKDPRIGVICKNKDGKVTGGGSDYPTLVPPSGQIKVETSLIVSAKPATCTAYIGPSVF